MFTAEWKEVHPLWVVVTPVPKTPRVGDPDQRRDPARAFWPLVSLSVCRGFSPRTPPASGAVDRGLPALPVTELSHGARRPPELLPCPQVASLKGQLDQEVQQRRRARLSQAFRAKK